MSAEGRPAAELQVPADAWDFHQEAIRRGWSDGLPLIPPASERVQSLLDAVDRDPLEIIAVLAPRQGEATVQAVAVNAAMAGCRPQHFPVVLAAVEAISQPPFNLDGINATTHPCAVFILVNGPVARAAGVHGGAGCFGPTFPANAAIGRAVRLVQLNVAGATPGRGDRATQGSPAKFAFCAAEREDASPWPPFQTTRGLAPEQSAVTTWAAEGPHNIQEHGSNTAKDILKTIAGAMGQAGSNNILGKGEPVLAFGPEHAATVAEGGYSREDVQNYLWENARYPAAKLSPEFLREVNVRMAGGNLPPHAPDELLPISDKPEEIHVIVAGGPGKHSSWMPTFGGLTRPVTVEIPAR